MITKFDNKKRAASSFKYYFLHEVSQFVSLNLLFYEFKF